MTPNYYKALVWEVYVIKSKIEIKSTDRKWGEALDMLASRCPIGDLVKRPSLTYPHPRHPVASSYPSSPRYWRMVPRRNGPPYPRRPTPTPAFFQSASPVSVGTVRGLPPLRAKELDARRQISGGRGERYLGGWSAQMRALSGMSGLA